MALYFMASFVRCEQDGEKKISQHMQVVVTNGPESEDEAERLFRENFTQSPQAKAGWELAGDPSIVEIHQGHIAQWGKWISPAPATPPKKEVMSTVLRLVKS